MRRDKSKLIGKLRDDLITLQRRSAVISVCINDIDEIAHTHVKNALEELDKCADRILLIQKQRGKKFPSDEEIDIIVSSITKNK